MPAATTLLDLRGKTITTYVVYRAHAALTRMGVGQRLDLVTTASPAMAADIPAWCRMAGHKLIEARTEGRDQHFVIACGEGPPSGRRLAMIISDDGLLELLSPLGFALAGALEGMQVSLYFQGPGVRVLSRRYRPQLHGIGRPFSRFPRSALAKAGHVHPHEKLHELLELGARLYACGPSLDHFGVAAEDVAFEPVTVAAYFTFMEVMSGAEVVL